MRKLIVLGIVLAVLAGLGGIGWFVVAGIVDQRVAAFLARSAERGRVITCDDRRIEGFPARMVVVCGRAGFTEERGGRTMTITLGRVTARLGLDDPRNLHIEAASPATVRRGETPPVDLGWRSLLGRVELAGTQPREFRLTVDGVTVRAPGVDIDGATIARLEARGESEPGIQPAEGSAAFSLSATGVASPKLAEVLRGPDPVDIAVAGRLTRAPAVIGRQLPAVLEDWRRAGGELTFTRIAVTRAVATLEAQGVFALDAERRPIGRLTGQASGFADLLAPYAGQAAALAALLPIGGRGGRLPIALTIRDGRVRVGPVTLGEVKPLY